MQTRSGSKRAPAGDGVVDRRGFLRSGLSALGALALSRPDRLLVPGAPPNDDADGPLLVVVNLDGGNDGLNTVVPLQMQRYHEVRRTLAIDPAEAISLDRGPFATRAFGLHPTMTGLGELYERGSLAIVQKVGFPEPSQSHFLSREVWSRGCRRCEDDHPDSGWIARYKDRFARHERSVVGVRVGQILELSGGDTAPVVLDSVTRFSPVRIDRSFPANHEYRRRLVRRNLIENAFEGPAAAVARAARQSYRLVESFDRAFSSPRNDAVYPETRLGDALRDTAVLLRVGWPMRVVFTESDGFDTHSEQAEQQAFLLEDLSAALSAFALDTRDDFWDRIVVVLVTEFGRTPFENGSGGTDHGWANPMLVLGGPVRGGMYGGTLTEQELGFEIRMEVDFRQVYGEILERHLDVDPAEVFLEPPATSGRLGFL